MILTSWTKNASHGARGAHPSRSPRHHGIDWVRVEQLYTFARNRAHERLDEATCLRDDSGIASARTALRTLESMYALAQGNDATASCAITYFRVRAMRDAQHPDFLGEWLGRPLSFAG